MTRVIFAGNTLTVDDKSVTMEFAIREAFEIDHVIVVLLDPDADLGTQSQYKNLIGLNANGEILWHADLPTVRQSDVYWRIASRSPLIASSFSSYDCEIDVRTGKVIRADFYK